MRPLRLVRINDTLLEVIREFKPSYFLTDPNRPNWLNQQFIGLWVHHLDCDRVVSGPRGPGQPEMQANGRGNIDLVGYIAVLHANGYTGPLNLEVIGAKEYSIEQCCTIAAESRGHMQASLQACGAR